MKTTYTFWTILIVYSATTVAAKCVKCPQIDPEICFKNNLAYDLGICCPSCIPAEDVVESMACIPELCMKQTCVDQTISNCTPGQVFVPKRACQCCDICVDKPLKPQCPDKCSRVKCADAGYKKCLSAGYAYVPRDGDCYCCGVCKRVSDVIKRRRCPRDQCLYSKCPNQTPDQCLPNQVLVPADGVCFCCDRCVFKKEVDDCTYK